MSQRSPRQYSRVQLESEILSLARSLGTPDKWANIIALRTADAVDEWIGDRDAVTDSDIRRVATQKLQELNPDIAFVYQNYDNII